MSLFDLNILLNSGRHQMLSKLASLSISSLRKLDDDVNKFYDRKHNRPIRNTILNFNKLVSDLDIETSSPDS